MDKEYIIKRAKSFAWNMGAMVVIGLLSMLLEPEMIEALGTPEIIVLFIGGLLTQITKYLNTGRA